MSFAVAVLLGFAKADGHKGGLMTDMPPPDYFWSKVEDQGKGMSPDEFMMGWREMDPDADNG